MFDFIYHINIIFHNSNRTLVLPTNITHTSVCFKINYFFTSTCESISIGSIGTITVPWN
jgi:hypothetical protein